MTVAPAAEVAQPRDRVAARGLLPAQPRQRRFALEQHAEGRAIGMDPEQPRVTQRWHLGPRIVQFGEVVGIVGKDRGAAEDQRAFALQRIVDAGLRKQARHQLAGFLVAFAQGQRPGSGEQQLRTTIHLFGRQPPQPFEHAALVAACHQRLIEAALGKFIGAIGLARAQRMAGRGFEQPVRGQPVRGTRMHRRALRCGQGSEALAQHVARQAVHAQPFAAFDGDEHRRITRQARQALPRVVGRDHHAAQVGMHVIDDGDAREKGDIGGVEVGQQQADELLAQRIALRAPCDGQELGIATAADGRQRQLQPQRPALGQLVQARRGIVVDALAETLVHQLEGFVELQAQHLLAHQRALSIGDEVFDREVAFAARGQHHAQVGRGVVQQVGQHLARRRRQMVGLVDEQHDIERRLSQLGEPGGDVFQTGRRGGCEEGVTEVRTSGTGTYRQRQRLDQALRAVLRLGEQPGHHRPARQVLETPLREQRCLAEAGGRLNQDHRLIAQAFVARQQARARHQVARHPRRRDLQQQVVRRVGAGLGVRGRHQRPARPGFSNRCP